MEYLLVIVVLTSHWFGPDTIEIKSMDFNTIFACEDAKNEFNLEFRSLDIKAHAECAYKGRQVK